jgi:ATP-binding cassette, subfamily B, bacterial MsbA
MRPNFFCLVLSWFPATAIYLSNFAQKYGMQVYVRILTYGKGLWRKGIPAILFLILYNVFNALSLAMIIPFLDILFSESSGIQSSPPASELLSLSGLKQYAFQYLDYAIFSFGKSKILLWFCIILVSSIFLKSLFRYLSSWLIVPMEQEIIYEIRERVFAHLTRLSIQFYTKRKKGGLISVVVSDVQVVQESVVGNIQSVIRDPLTMIVFLGTMIFLSWKLTLFTLIVLPLTGWLITALSKSLKRKANKGQEKLDSLISIVDEFVSGVRIVKAFNAEEFEQGKYRKQNREFYDTQVAISRRSDLASPSTEVLSILIVAVIILYGGNLILDKTSELKPSEFLGFIAIFSQFLAPIKTLSHSISKIQKGVASFDRIEKLLQEPITVPEPESGSALTEFTDKIEFKNVWFKYQDRDILKNINLTIRKGETVALVGPSGAGKSTLADLLPRFYDPHQGEICIDGIPLTQAKLADVRHLMGIVSQEGILFNDSILRNIAYGSEKISLDAVMEAAKIANAHEFIQGFLEGYYTGIGERGTRLSGGQRQRIAIARAVLKNPAILILDEATSALDTESEKQVQDALDRLMKNRTSLVIAHRLSTILKADRIVVLEAGEIKESGTHEELIQLDGLYRKLYDIQFGGRG